MAQSWVQGGSDPVQANEILTRGELFAEGTQLFEQGDELLALGIVRCRGVLRDTDYPGDVPVGGVRTTPEDLGGCHHRCCEPEVRGRAVKAAEQMLARE